MDAAAITLEWLAEKLLVREIPFRERPGSENDYAEKTTDFIMGTRWRACFFTKGTSSEERVGFQFVFSAFVFVFCFCFVFAFVYFLPSSSLFFFFFYFLFLFLLLVFPLLPSFSEAHKHGISPDSSHTESCTLHFPSFPLNL